MFLEKHYLSQVKQNEIYHISEFVVKENFKHHADKWILKSNQDEIYSIYKEEKEYLKNSKIFAFKNKDGDILGTIRVLKWDFIDFLPIQKMFGINPLFCTSNRNINEIWHIGRFAIKKGMRDISLLKKLMISAIAPVCKHKDNFAFAECDAKLLRILTLIGIKAEIVGKSIDYLGSETIPICMCYDGLIDFYNQNKELISSEFSA